MTDDLKDYEADAFQLLDPDECVFLLIALAPWVVLFYA